MNSTSPFGRNGSILEEEGSEWGSGTAVACIILALCFVVGVPGNLVVVWTIMKHVKQRSHTVLLILHLAVADLLVLVTLPLWIYSLAHSWVFGEVTCKGMVYVIHVCMYTSVYLITVMSMDRFLAVRYPFKMLQWKVSKIMHWVLAGTWVLALLLGIPAFIVRRMEQNADDTFHCNAIYFSSVALEIFYMCAETLVGFVIPFFILAVCYCKLVKKLHQVNSKTKQKSTFLISSVVVAFALCWLPHHIINIISIAHPNYSEGLPETASFISGALAFISSSVNPMLYAFTARHFQGGLRKSPLVKLFQEMASLPAQEIDREPKIQDCSNNATDEEDISVCVCNILN